MRKILRVAARDFIATVSTKGFLIGLLVLPATVIVVGALAPHLIGDLDELEKQITAQLTSRPTGEVAVMDRTGVLLAGIRTELGPEMVVVERPPDADVEQEEAWLSAAEGGAGEPRRLALVVVHPDAVAPAPGEPYGSYDLHVSTQPDEREVAVIQDELREAIVAARVAARGLDRETIDSMFDVEPSRAVDIGRVAATGALTAILPMAFTMLMFLGIATGGQLMLTSTVEEKSSRVVEVLLSAVSPMQLMAGKLLGHTAASMLAMSLYLVVGLLMLASFTMLGLLDLRLILYLVLFFVIAFLVLGSLMMAVGAAVNEISEAQTLQMPIMLVIMVPWLLWIPISSDPSSALAVAASFLPPINTFGMVLRLASSAPPPWWQVWLSAAVGIASALGALWVAAKIFRIGLLVHGKPPSFATLVRWVRSA